jgi:signal transduction histidine kinase
MASVTPPRSLAARVLRYAPWSAWARGRLAFMASGVPLGAFAAGCAVAVWQSAAGILLVLLPALPLLVWLLTMLQRSRFRALLGLEIPELPRPALRYGLRRTGTWLRSDATWRRVGYHFVAAPLLAVGAVLALAMIGAGLVLASVFAWIYLLPATVRVERLGDSTTAGYATGLGVLMVLLAPGLAELLTRLDIRLAAALLGPSRAAQLEHRVEELAESRAGVVDAADAERRRIERDLHDGVQQRLVSLAMNLGLARKTLTDVPEDAMRVIVEAHQEAQAAITELRDLVRGLHPAVLEDRGLDAALSGIAARAPFPVRLSVDVPRRPAPTVEAVAYFTVSEALTNVAKHARASRAEVEVRLVGDRLRVLVTDDGVGGADAAKGTGLIGLRKRVGSVDGAFTLSSPLGGPTVITVELPCVL